MEKTAGEGAVPREFNYLPEIKLRLMRFKLDSSFSVSHQKVERKMMVLCSVKTQLP